MLLKEKRDNMAIDFYNRACDMLARRTSYHLFADRDDPEDDGREFYWIGDDVGGLCDFGDCDILTPDDMVRILRDNVPYDKYAEWRDASLEQPHNAPHINLRSWLMGARYDLFNNDK